MTQESSLALVREIFERFNSGDREAALELLAADFVAEIPPSCPPSRTCTRGTPGRCATTVTRG